MNKLTAFLILLACAMLETGGDALMRKGMQSGRIALYASAAIVLSLYGWLVNRPPWSFGALLGVYVTLFFLVAQVTALMFFGEKPTAGVLVGGALIFAGGVTITIWR